MAASPIEHGRYVSNLPRDYYLSSEIFEQELRRVLSRQWLLVGHVSSVRDPGDYYVKRVGPETLIIVRDKSGRIRAYFNVCRHRGFRICKENEAGHGSRFTCSYHGWTYGLDGALAVAPTARDGQEFDFKDFALHEAWCETFHGFIFVYLDRARPPSLAEACAAILDEEKMRRIEPERMKLAHRETYIINANWKALLENDMECFHCPTSHPSLSVACDFRGFYAETRSSQHFPLREGMRTFSIDGDWVCTKPLGADLPHQFSCGFLLWPNFCGPVFFADHCVSLETTPLSVDRTQLISEWYVHEDAVEGRDYDRERLIKVFDVTNREDGALAERNYAGITSMRFQPGPLSATREDGVKTALRRYVEMMEAGD